MAQGPSQRALLLPHPDASGDAVWSVTVETELSAESKLVCRYAVHGDMSRVRIPGAGAGHRTDGLWRHTCCEAFVATAAAGYYEFNFSPALDWAAYHFDGYRAGMSAAPLTQPPGLQVRRTAGQLDLTATVHFAGLAPLRAAAVLHLALAMVIEEDHGRLSYWALAHGPGNPDFHHPDSFALQLHAA
jgi:hypothetical protein